MAEISELMEIQNLWEFSGQWEPMKPEYASNTL